jgi:hypothetical protein
VGYNLMGSPARVAIGIPAANVPSHHLQRQLAPRVVGRADAGEAFAGVKGKVSAPVALLSVKAIATDLLPPRDDPFIHGIVLHGQLVPRTGRQE